MQSFFAQTGIWAGSKATNLLSSYLTAQCIYTDPEEVNLRAGKHGDDIYLDMGDSDYRVIHIHRNGYEVLNTSPILFTRSHISRSLPEVQPSGLPLNELIHFVRIREEALPVLIASMISSWMTNENNWAVGTTIGNGWTETVSADDVSLPEIWRSALRFTKKIKTYEE